ncbi:ATP-binding cassette domain-containing protein [Chitinibacter tainanensis]|uniref:ATP-binding cassette domain-containing protein n=1 Tax=Chitinibacter tainanensis TaxID=230667 RepID=UPI000414783B|nr:ATP-binding cassette domain-containing protein [Chitinibacter tainanensis]
MTEHVNGQWQTEFEQSARLQALHEIIATCPHIDAQSAKLLASLLCLHQWSGSERQLQTALSVIEAAAPLVKLCAVLQQLGFRLLKRPPQRYAGRIGQLLVLPAGLAVDLGRQQQQILLHDGLSLHAVSPAAIEQVIELEPDPLLSQPQHGGAAWLGDWLQRAAPELRGVGVLSALINLIALVVSLFTMLVYNSVIPTGAYDTMLAMSVGALMLVLGAWVLRLVRNQVLSALSARTGQRIAQLALQRTLDLALAASMRSGVDNNLSRMRSLESVRQWFSSQGPLNIDFPFVLLFLLVIALIGGLVVLVPLLSLLLFALLAWPLNRWLGWHAQQTGTANRQLGALQLALVQRLRSVRHTAAPLLWQQFLPQKLLQSAKASRDHALVQGAVLAAGQMLSSLTVLATMAVGIWLVLAQQMSTGGLIATMMLIWRITTPAQQMLQTQVRLRSLHAANQQLVQLLATPSEPEMPLGRRLEKGSALGIELDRLYLRFAQDREPALQGLSWVLPAGASLALVGPNGAGKTVLVEALLGLHPPQNGRVLVNGTDLRQIELASYRAAVGYLPQRMPGVPLTLRESLTLRHQQATDTQLLAALTDVAGPDWYRYFNAGDAQSGLAQQIMASRQDLAALRGRYIARLASALLGQPPLLILDDPLPDRDPELDPYLQALLRRLQGKTTLILITHRPELIQLMSHIAVLHAGSLAHFGPVVVADSVEARS